MAQIFISVLGDKLVKSYLFESDLNEDCPLLPSPNQLKYKILIKNKKLQRQPVQQQLSIQQQNGVNGVGNASSGNATNQQAQLQHQLSQQQQNSPPAHHHQQLSRKQLSDASKSSILQTQLSQQQHESTGANQNGSGKKDFGADSSSPSTGSASNKGENGIVKKIRTISTRLTAAAAEPKIKQNVVSFIHKSKSLTDNAFNKIAAGRNGNGSKPPNLDLSQVETANLLDGDSEKSPLAVGNGNNGTGPLATTSSGQQQLPASPASLSVSPSVGGLSIQQQSGQGQTNGTDGGDTSNYINNKLQQRRRTSIRNVSSFERARTIDNQEVGSSGKPADGSFEFSAGGPRGIKNSTSTELNELFDAQGKSEPRDSATSTILLGCQVTTTSTQQNQTVTSGAATSTNTNSTFIQQLSSSIQLTTSGKNKAANAVAVKASSTNQSSSSSSQIAPELSELVIYTQAVKFRDLNPVPASSFMSHNAASRMLYSGAAGGVGKPSYSRKSMVLNKSNNNSVNNSAQPTTSAGVNANGVAKPTSLNTSQQLMNQVSITSSDLNGSRGDLHQASMQATRAMKSVGGDECNYSHQIISLNESKAKQICKKRPTDVIQHTETQLIRCYPNARRFDSSNFMPITFWSCGMQLIALNYQTIDPSQIVNSTLFEQNNMAGYVLKPPQLWSRAHPDYGRFNPFEKKKDAEYVSFCLRLISGQYLTETLFGGSGQSAARESLGLSGGSSGQEGLAGSGMPGDPRSADLHHHASGGAGASNGADSSGLPFGNLLTHHQQQHYHRHRNSSVELLQATSTCVEVEVIGIPCDCAKEKTKTFNRNALNPIWNEDFVFHIVFPDLAFIRFSIIDANNNHTISQRVIPVKRMLPGYRHIRLRNMQNQPLELASLFVHTRRQVEHVASDSNQHSPSSSSIMVGVGTGISVSQRQSQQLNSSTADLSGGVLSGPLGSVPKGKHKQFKLTVYGLTGGGGIAGDCEDENDTGVQVKVTQETTVQQVIEQALSKVNKSAAAAFREKKNYILVQQVERRWSNATSHHHGVNNASTATTPEGAAPNSVAAAPAASSSGSKSHRTARSFFQQERTKSLCVFYNSGLLSYAKRLQREGKNSSRETAISNAAAATANAVTAASSTTNIPKDVKILQYHEKIMEIQNKWTGNGKFIVRAKTNFLPFKKERDGSATSGSAFGSTSGGGIFSFSVKSLISGGVGRRKKSAPEQELRHRAHNYDNYDDAYGEMTGSDLAMCSSGGFFGSGIGGVGGVANTSGATGGGGEDQTNIPTEYLTRMAQVHLTSSANLHTYYIYLNESCCVEVSATQQGSTVHNLLLQALRKIKASEECSEYCLVEHIELEQTLASREALASGGETASANATTTSAIGPPSSASNNQITQSAAVAAIASSAVVTSSLGNVTAATTGSSNMLSSSTTTASGLASAPCSSSAAAAKKKVTVRTRILGATENLFVLTHVWNQMKLEGSSGFKFAKVILTKRRALTKLHQASLKKRKQAILAQHRMSLQPKPTTTTTTTTTMSSASATKTTTTTTMTMNVIKQQQQQQQSGCGSVTSSRKSSIINETTSSAGFYGHFHYPATQTSHVAPPVPHPLAGNVVPTRGSNNSSPTPSTPTGTAPPPPMHPPLERPTRFRPVPKRERSSLNRLVRQKSFEDSNEFLNQLARKEGIIQSSYTIDASSSLAPPPLPLTEHETCTHTTVTTTTTEQVDAPIAATTASNSELTDLQAATSEIDHPGVGYVPHRRVTEVIESTLALSTEIVMSKTGDDGESRANEGDVEDENELDDDLDDADLDLDLDAIAVDKSTGILSHSAAIAAAAAATTSRGADDETFVPTETRKKSVFINETRDIRKVTLFRANSAETAKRRAAGGAKAGDKNRRQSTFQRLFKLKL